MNDDFGVRNLSNARMKALYFNMLKASASIGICVMLGRCLQLRDDSIMLIGKAYQIHPGI